MLFDSHAHLNNAELTDEERAAWIEAIETSSLDYVMNVGFDPASSELAARQAEEYSWCYAAAGCHPHDTKDMDEAKLQQIRELAGRNKVMAIGEIGLDFHYDISDRDTQREWFRKQIRLANELKMPIAIHAREADQEVMDILKEEGAFSEERKSWFPKRPDPECWVTGTGDTATADMQNLCDDARVLLHCFSGSAELGKQYVKLGATLSVAGPVTYKNNRKTVEMVRAIPLSFLLVETDSPYLTPVPFRGRPNMPIYVEHTAAKIAEIKEISYEKVAEQTKQNAMRFYGIK